jgi:hypothetical protein
LVLAGEDIMSQNKRALALRMAGLPSGTEQRPRVDPVERALRRAPYEDEPLTEAEIRELDEAEAEEGPDLSPAELRKALGLD